MDEEQMMVAAGKATQNVCQAKNVHCSSPCLIHEQTRKRHVDMCNGKIGDAYKIGHECSLQRQRREQLNLLQSFCHFPRPLPPFNWFRRLLAGEPPIERRIVELSLILGLHSAGMEGTAARRKEKVPNIQDLRAEIWQELERRHAVYMNQHVSILDDVKLSLQQFHQEIKRMQLTLQQNLDLNRDLYLEFKEVRQEVSVLMQCSRRPQHEGGEPCCGSQNGDATASSSPPGVQGSPPGQSSAPWQRFPIEAASGHRRQPFSETPFQERPHWDQYNQMNDQYGLPPELEIEFPRFGSGDPTDWIFYCELYFRCYNIPESDFVMIASLHLDEPAASWFLCHINQNCSHDWTSFKRDLFRRFVDMKMFAKKLGVGIPPPVAGG